MNSSTISRLVGSSEYQAITDDALKDEDNAAWVMELDPEVRSQWIERIRWIRLADRLAENELLEAGNSEFQRFYGSWKWLMATAQVQPSCAHRDVFCAMRDRWFREPSPLNQLSIESWNRYLTAIMRYHQRNLRVELLSDYEAMLENLAASFFQVLPFLTEQHWQAAGQFGVLDQFYNNLRDLREDAEQGLCYLPTEVLDRFGVSRAEIIELRAIENPCYRPMMQFWVHEYLPRLRRKAYPFILAPNLHPSWQVLRDWSLHRYKRIERIFQRCDYDYLRFPKLYWREVQRDLVLMLPGIFGQQTIARSDSKAKCVSYPTRNCKLSQITPLNASECETWRTSTHFFRNFKRVS